MDHPLDRAFMRSSTSAAPTAGLEDRVMARVRRLHGRRVFLRKVAAVTASIASAGAMVVAAIVTISEIGRSGLVSYLSLAFSDPSIVVSVWRDYTLTILEALPVGSLFATTASGLCLLFAFRLFSASFTHTHLWTSKRS